MADLEQTISSGPISSDCHRILPLDVDEDFRKRMQSSLAARVKKVGDKYIKKTAARTQHCASNYPAALRS